MLKRKGVRVGQGRFVRKSPSLTRIRSAIEVLEDRALLAAGIPAYDHVVIVIEENHAFDTILGNASAPYINALAIEGTSFTNMHALTQPSQPNYINLFYGTREVQTSSGATVLISTNNLVTQTGGVQIGAADPGGQNTPAVSPNIAAELRNAGYSFGGYSHNLPFTGSQVFENNNAGANYARRHVPWPNSQDNAWIDDSTPSLNGFSNTLPRSVNMPFTDSPFDDANPDFSTLPTLSIVIPDDDFNMHDGSVNAGDTWLRDHFDAYYQWAKTHNSLLIITWDESSQSVYNPATGIGNPIPTIFAGAFVKPGNNATPRTYLNILRTIEGMYDLRTNPANAGNLTPLESDSGSMSGPAIDASLMIDDVWANLPTGLVADAVSFTQLDLTWLDFTPNETGHTVERSTDGGAFVEISSTVPANATTFSDTTVTAGHSYSYRVRAFTDPGPVYTAYSNTATTSTTTPSAPTVLESSQAAFSTIGLTWTDNANNETGFQIERSATGNDGDYSPLASVAPNITAFNDQTAGEGNTWHYRVRAYNGLGDSAYTNSSTTTIANGIPNAILAAPVDNSPIDGNVAVGSLLVSPQTNFKFLLTDIGSDINDASVVSAAVTLTKDSGSGPVTLVNGTDYTFNYAPGTNLVTILPTSFSFGIGTYVLTLNPNIIADTAPTPHFVSSKQYTIVIEASPPLIFPTPLNPVAPQGSQVFTGNVTGIVNGPTVAILQGGTTFTEPVINANSYEGSAAELGFTTTSVGTVTVATQLGVQSASTNAVAQTAFTTAPTAGKVYMVRNSSTQATQTLVHTVTFSPVTLAPSDTNQLSINVFLGNDNSPGGSTYEVFSSGGFGANAQDYIKITIDAVDNNNVHSLLTVLDTQAGNQDLDVVAMAGTLVKGGWKTIVTPIGQEFVSATLIIEAANNSSQGNEVFAFDKIAFASTIPNAQSAINYTIDLDAGQNVTLVAHPDEPALQPFVEISGPGLNSVGATATAANRDAVLQGFTATNAGTYTISIGTANSISGEYTLSLLLNSLVEREAHNGPTDNTRPSAQNIDAGFASVGSGVSRGAVAGTAETAEGSILEYQGHIFSLHNGHYYGLTNTTGTWAEKEAEAVSIGAHLVTINDAAENAFLVSNFGNGIRWIGLNDQAVEGTFVWSSGEPVTFTNWAPGQPDNRNNSDFVLGGSFFGPGLWNDTTANTTNVGIIELTSVPPAPGQDFYSLTLTQGQSTTFVASGGVALEIQDDEGTVLASSVTSGAEPMARIAGYSAPSTGFYYLRVVGAGATVNYNLAMVKGASFDTQTGAINLAPTNVSAGGPYVIAQGSSVTLNASASNPEATDTLSYAWDLNGDGVFGDLTGASPTLTWAQLLAAGVNGDVGLRMINVRVDDGQGNRVNSSGSPLTIIDGAPRVMSILVGSMAWSPAFIDHLVTHGLASSSGYLMPTGAAQTNALPWANLNQVSITFTENVGVAYTDLQLIGANAPAAPAITRFEYDLPSRTATWTLAGSLTTDKLLLALNDRATDSTGNAIDGEWTDNVSSVSGNGQAGGNFMFRFSVLPGDVDGDGSVTTTDVTLVRMLVPSNTSSTGFNLRADFDGNGSISTSDVTQARLKVGTTLPTGSPVPPVSQAAIARSLPTTTTVATAGSAGSSASTARSRAFETFGPPAPTSTTPFQKFIGPLLPRDLADSLARGLAIQATVARESSDSSAAATDILLGGSTDWRVAAGLVRPSNRCEHAGKAIAK